MIVSLLIPSKNRLDLLKLSLRTILAQNDQNIEIIISDNASSEDYKTYIDQLSDSRIVYFRQENPVPVTDNWQKALSLATGDYILMLGDDDGLTPDFFSSIRPLLDDDGPDIVYMAAYHYCYPNVIPESPQGYFGAVGCEFLPNKNGPFCLLPHYARDLAASVLEFRHRYGFNAQHFLLKRSFIEQVSDIGPLYQSPYPDFFAAVVTFTRARTIVVLPKPSVIIGISPKSFGAYYFSARQKEGFEFLANENVDPVVLSALKDSIMPGDKNNTNWLIAAETARRAIASSHPHDLNIDRYTSIQINSIMRNRYVTKLPNEADIIEIQKKLSSRELLLFESLRTTIEVVATSAPILIPNVLDAIDRQTGQYGPSYYANCDIGTHNNITDAFNWLSEMGNKAIKSQSKTLTERVSDYKINLAQANQLKNSSSRMTNTYLKLRRIGRAIALRLPPVRRLYERATSNQNRIDLLEAENKALKAALEECAGDKMPSAEVWSVTDKGADCLRIVITRDGKHITITPDKFDDFKFKQGDVLNVGPPRHAANLLRTPEQHFHIPTGDGRGIRVPPKMTFASFKGFLVPEHLIALTGAGFETLDSIGKAHIAGYAKHLGISPDMNFLEIGSGIGRDAFQLIDYLSPKGHYLGVDVQRESILWCQKNITREHPNVEFCHFNAFHELHNPLATKTTMDFRLPLADRSVDRIALGSVFTHIFEDEIIHYMREMARVLKPDGLVYATFFLYNDEVIAKSQAKSLTPYNLRFEHPYGNGCYINDANYPTGAVAYTDEAMQRMINASGLRLDRPYLKGAWSGYYLPEQSDDGQDVAILSI